MAKPSESARDPESDVLSWLSGTWHMRAAICCTEHLMLRSGNRNAILNFCRPVSPVPFSAFEWKDFELATCAVEISSTLISEYLKGVREVGLVLQCPVLFSFVR
jgi:hypothetical protein